MKSDILFLHAPSVYDFRKRSIMFGPVSDLVPSTPIFEMYPIGFSILSEYLERFGYKARVINIALWMLKEKRFDPERFISRLSSPLVFGIDLHWLPHAHGSLELAKILKKYHPHTPILFGGFSSTYFHEELIKYPEVDFVLKGDSTEEPLRMLIESLKKGSKDFSHIPNLDWKDSSGGVHSNPIEYVPDSLEHINLDYSHVMRSVVRYRDLTSYIPFINWWEYPIVAALSCRGCTRNCATCGGSSFTFRNFYGRERIAMRPPELLAGDVIRITNYMRSPIFILGDLRQGGEGYARIFLRSLKEAKVANEVALEFFTPPPPEFFKVVSDSLPNWSLEISLETHDEVLRERFGKASFTHDELVISLKAAFKYGCKRADIYFMTGIPGQTKKSVLETIDYCKNLYEELGGDSRLIVFISPMAPFLDPGSRAFENPGRFGYKILCKTLEEHREALLLPSWKYIMNYESETLPRDELVEATYESALGLNKVKSRYGAISASRARIIEKRIVQAREVMKRIDEIMEKDFGEREVALEELRLEMRKHSISTVCDKRELEWKTSYFSRFKVGRILAMLLSKGW